MDIAVIIRESRQPDDAIPGIVALKADPAWVIQRSECDNTAFEVFFTATPPQGLCCGWTLHRAGWVAWVAELTTLLELRRVLSLSPSTPDAQTMRLAVERWGVDAVHRTYSVWAGALWQQDEKVLYFFRDRIGLIPAFYYEKPPERSKIKVFSTSMRLIQQVCPGARQVNLERISAFLSSTDDTHRDDFFAGIRRIHPGELWKWQPDRPQPQIQRYWEPGKQKDSPGDLDHPERALLECFQSICSDYFEAGYSPITSVSGGMDSTVLLAVQVEQWRRIKLDSSRLSAATMGFPSLPMVDETPWTSALAAHLDFPIPAIFLEDRWPLLQPEKYVTNPGLGPPFHPGADYEDAFIQRACQDSDSRTIFSGIGADQLFITNDYLMLDALLEDAGAALPRALYDAGRRVGIRRLLRYSVSRSFVGPYLRLARAYIHKARQSGVEYPWRSPDQWVQPASFDHPPDADSLMAGQMTPFYLRWSWELVIREIRRKSYDLGITYHLPFLRADFVDLIFSLKPYDLNLGDGSRKDLLRRMAQGLLPESIRQRPKGGSFCKVVDAGLAHHESARVVDLFSKNSILADWGLIDTQSFLKVFGQYREFCYAHQVEDISSGAMELWTTIAVELWGRKIVDNLH